MDEKGEESKCSLHQLCATWFPGRVDRVVSLDSWEEADKEIVLQVPVYLGVEGKCCPQLVLFASQKETEIVLHNGELLGGWKGGRRQKLPWTLCYSKRQRLFCKHWGWKGWRRQLKLLPAEISGNKVTWHTLALAFILILILVSLLEWWECEWMGWECRRSHSFWTKIFRETREVGNLKRAPSNFSKEAFHSFQTI